MTNNCPNCGAPMQELFLTQACSAECDLKPKVPEFKLEFDDTLIDWPWFVGFCAWAAAKIKTPVVPKKYGSSIWLEAQGHGYILTPTDTRRSLRVDLAKYDLFKELREL